MKPRDPALEAARRIAAGQAVDPGAVAASDPKLARGLSRMAAIGRALAGDAPVGSTWGHLQRLEPAGRGTFGEVFRAWDPTLDRHVALKLKRRDAPDAIFSGRDFVAEARRLARVRHPNVLAVHGAGYHDDRAGLWADWIEGETLHARLAREGRLSSDALLRLGAELAAALEAVHDTGLVHGDVTASNVMLDRHGHAVLMDFGAGFASGEDAARLAAGTPHYLAPEAVRGEPVSAAIDVYALGVLLHRASCGAYPQGGAPARAIARDWQAPLRDALCADPARRPTAAQLRARIEALRAAPLRRARRTVRLALGAGLLAFGVAASIGYWRAEAARARAEAALRRAEVSNAFMDELLGLAAPDALGPGASLRDLLDAAPGLVAGHAELAAGDRAHLLAGLASVESGMANDEVAARLASDAARLAASADPGSDEALRLAGAAVRLRAIAGDPAAVVDEGLALLARAAAEDRPPALRAQLEFDVAEAEFRLSLLRTSPELLARIRARIDRVLADPSLLDGATESQALRRLANLMLEAGEFEAALKVGARAVERSIERLGAAHPLTALARRVQGWIELSNGRSADAIGRFRTNLALHEGKLGARSRSMVDDRIGLGYAILLDGRPAEALPVSQQAWGYANALYGKASRSTIDAGLTLSEALLANGDVAGAIALLADLRERLRADGRRASRQYLHVARELAKALQRRGLVDDEAAARADCRAAGLEAFGAEHSLTQRCAERAEPGVAAAVPPPS
jgi:hypothetical protein